MLAKDSFTTNKINLIFLSLSVIIKWVLNPIVMATALEKMDNMATGGGVHTVMTTT